MEIAKAKIKNIQQMKPWTTPDNTLMNKFEIKLDNGLSLEKYIRDGRSLNKKVGDTVTYDSQVAKEKNKLVEVSQADFQKDMKILRNGCLKAAVVLFTASKNSADQEKVIEVSKRFEQYCLTGE
tara:strand:+ start:1269 stop:1640 length:372 start_codon:yes stop_codon:yes gene_type:complete